MPEHPQNQRRASRFPVKLFVAIYSKGGSGYTLKGTTTNASSLGLLVEFPAPCSVPDLGTEVFVWLGLLAELSGTESVGMTATAQIVRIENASGQRPRTALVILHWHGINLEREMNLVPNQS